MWKKPLGSFQTQPLKGKDVKGLRKIVGDAALGDKPDVWLWKIEQRLHAYAIDGQPLFVDTTGKLSKPPLPTIFALWRAPDLLPTMHVVPDVSSYLLNGADLMWPGVVSHGTLKKGDLVQVLVLGNPCCVAIGEALNDTQEGLRVEKGRALKILTYFGDALTDAVAPTHLKAPEGFSRDRVAPSPAYVAAAREARAAAAAATAAGAAEGDVEEEGEDVAASCEEGEGVEERGEAEETEEVEEEADEDGEEAGGTTLDALLAESGGDDDEEEVEVEAAAAAAPRGVRFEDEAESGGSDGEAKVGKRHARAAALRSKKEREGKGKKKGGGGGGGGAPAEEAAAVTTEEMDALVLRSFVGGLAGLTKADLPILVSAFYSQHMLPARPEGSTLDMKKSSFKKVGALMLMMEREGAVKLKQKSAGIDNITAIDKRCKKIFELTQEFGKPDPSAAAGPSASAAASAVSPAVMPLGRIAKTKVLYRPKPDSKLFKPVFGGSKEALTKQEVFDALAAYVESAKLEVKAGKGGGRGQAPDPTVCTDGSVFPALYSAKVTVSKTVVLKRLSEKASLGFNTDEAVKVTSVEGGGTAQNAGMRPGDIVCSVGGQAVKTLADMGAAMKTAGKVVEVVLKTKESCPRAALQSDLRARTLKQTLPSHSIVHAGPPGGEATEQPGKGEVPQIKLEIRFRASKKVTFVNNLDRFGFDVAASAKELQALLQGSVTIMSPPVAPASSTLLLQGRQIKQLAKFFETYGVAKEHVLVCHYPIHSPPPPANAVVVVVGWFRTKAHTASSTRRFMTRH